MIAKAAAGRTRRTILGTSATALLLGACAPGPHQGVTAAKKSGPATVQQWSPFTAQFQLDGIGKLNAAFTAQEPDITMETAFGVTVEKTIAAVAGGSGPDVHNKDGAQFLDLVRRKVFRPIDDLVARSRTASKGKFSPAQLDAGGWAEKLYGLATWSNGTSGFLFWNTAHFAEAGLSRPPATLDDVRQYGERLTRVGADGQLARIGFELLADNYWNDPFSLLTRLYDVTWYDKKNGKVSLDQPGLVAALEYATRTYQFLRPEHVDAFRKSYSRNNTPTSAMPQGMESIKFGSDTTAGVMAQNAPGITLEIGWAPSEAKKTWVAQGSGQYTGVVTGSRVPEAAWRYVEYLTTPAANQIILDTIGWVVYNKDLAKGLDVSRVPHLRFIMDAPEKAQKVYGPVVLPIDAAAPTAAGVQKVIRGQQSARDMLQELNTKLQTDLDTALRTG